VAAPANRAAGSSPIPSRPWLAAVPALVTRGFCFTRSSGRRSAGTRAPHWRRCPGAFHQSGPELGPSYVVHVAVLRADLGRGRIGLFREFSVRCLSTRWPWPSRPRGHPPLFMPAVLRLVLLSRFLGRLVLWSVPPGTTVRALSLVFAEPALEEWRTPWSRALGTVASYCLCPGLQLRPPGGADDRLRRDAAVLGLANLSAFVIVVSPRGHLAWPGLRRYHVGPGLCDWAGLIRGGRGWVIVVSALGPWPATGSCTRSHCSGPSRA